MALPERSPSDLSSKKKQYLVRKKLLKKKPPVRTCNKVKKEEIDDFKNPTIWKSYENHALLVHGKAKTSGSALERANEVQARLPSEFPSFVKLMSRSHVTGGFWLGLPKKFSDLHLPKHDATVVLVDEKNEEYYTKYLIDKNGLSAGWRGFSIKHNLLEGDAVVFQLVKPCRIRVYIVRAHSLSEIDGVISLLNLDFQAKPNDHAEGGSQNAGDVKNINIVAKNFMEPNATSSDQEATANSENVPALDAQSGNESDFVPAHIHQSGNATGVSDSEIFDGIRFSESLIDFEDVEDFNSFSILVDGLIIDSEIPKNLRTKYYELCYSQNSFLHSNLVKGLNCKLAAGIISETVNIADAIRASKLNTCCDYLQTWDKTLKAFEDMGMAVGFLRVQIQNLVCLQREEQEIVKSKTLQ